MKNPTRPENMEQIHNKLVEQIVSAAKPTRPIQSALAQWATWLFLSLGIMALSLMKMGVLNSPAILRQAPSLIFLITGFLGASMAAWEAIASSLPGRQTGKVYHWTTGLIIALLVLIPFLFFSNEAKGFDLAESVHQGMGCMGGVSMVGLVPWILLGWRISRNATFDPLWSGAWSGLSAFLLGTVTVQLHCPNWTTSHMILAHLLPAAFFSFITTWVGAMWFSRWKK